MSLWVTLCSLTPSGGMIDIHYHSCILSDSDRTNISLNVRQCAFMSCPQSVPEVTHCSANGFPSAVSLLGPLHSSAGLIPLDADSKKP